jgi:glucosyl-3-phosphoglycerate synthase
MTIAATSRQNQTDIPRPRGEDAETVLERLLRTKGGTTITVCLPTYNHAHTVGPIVHEIAQHLVRECRLVDEVLVVDGGSTDDTCDEAAAAGATVLLAADAFSEFGEPVGHGDLLWRAVGSASGDIVVWVDPDLTSFSADYVVRLVEPLMLDDDVVLVRGTARKGYHARAARVGVAEAVARPVLTLLDPEFSSLREPFTGEYAGRRDALRSVAFEPDHGVEIGLLVDLAKQYGAHAVREVEIGDRDHRYRSSAERARQTRQMLAALSRAGTSSVRGALPLRPAHDDLRRLEEGAL